MVLPESTPRPLPPLLLKTLSCTLTLPVPVHVSDTPSYKQVSRAAPYPRELPLEVMLLRVMFPLVCTYKPAPASSASMFRLLSETLPIQLMIERETFKSATSELSTTVSLLPLQPPVNCRFPSAE